MPGGWVGKVRRSKLEGVYEIAAIDLVLCCGQPKSALATYCFTDYFKIVKRAVTM